MNLKLSIVEIQAITGATFIGNALFEKSGQIETVIIDSRSPKITSDTLFILFKGNKVNAADYVADFELAGGRVVLTDKELNSSTLNQLVVPNTLVALQQLAIHHRKKFDIPVIGITGSNGKTTVKEWLYHLLKNDFHIVRSPKSYNSQIGVALSVLEMNEKDELGLFEAGISKPNEMDQLQQMIQPTIGIFTGIGDAHNAGFSAENPEEEKKKEKFKLFKNVNTLIEWTGKNYVVHSFKKNQTDTYALNVLPDAIELKSVEKSVTVNFSNNTTAFFSNIGLIALAGIHFGLSSAKINSATRSLPIISMRLEKLRGKNNNLLINDAYSIDAKSLEIGLQYLSIHKAHQKTVLFIAEDLNMNKTLLPVLEHLLTQISVDDVVYIGAENCFDQYHFITAHYHSVADFLAHPINFKNSSILFTGSRNCKLEKVVGHYMDKKHITRLEIDLSKIRNNLNFYRSKLAARTKVLSMVKAQSYGGGIVEMANFLANEGVDYFGVAYADEGLALRKGAIKKPILVMNPEQASYDTIIDNELEPSIYSLANLNAFIHQLIIKGKKNFPIHIKLETGMNRLGFVREELSELIETIKVQPEVYVKSMFSHLAVADDITEKKYTEKQIATYLEFVNYSETELGYSFIKHICNSSGALNYPSAHFDMIRLGIGAFGLIKPEIDNGNLENALRLTSQISLIRNIKKGETVGYGRNFKAERDTLLGVIPIGYGDGFRRSLGNKKWSVRINGENYPLIGNVCMDACMVDLTNAGVSVGDSVQLFGDGNSVFEMSQVLQTIPYEIISSISSRVQRVYSDE